MLEYEVIHANTCGSYLLYGLHTARVCPPLPPPCYTYDRNKLKKTNHVTRRDEEHRVTLKFNQIAGNRSFPVRREPFKIKIKINVRLKKNNQELRKIQTYNYSVGRKKNLWIPNHTVSHTRPIHRRVGVEFSETESKIRGETPRISEQLRWRCSIEMEITRWKN